MRGWTSGPLENAQPTPAAPHSGVPLGLCLFVVAACLSARLLQSWSLSCPVLISFLCGLSEDLTTAVALGILMWSTGPRLEALVAALAVVLLGIDYTWWVTTGSRLRLDTMLFVLEKLFTGAGVRWHQRLSMLTNNLAMVPHGLFPAVLVWVVVLVGALRWSTRLRMAATLSNVCAAVGVTLVLCGAGKMSCHLCSSAAPSLNALAVLWSDAWQRLRPSRVEDMEVSRQSFGLVKRLSRSNYARTRQSTISGAPRTRSVVMIVLESVGAMYTDLYNPDAHGSMPFLRELFERSPNGKAFMVERFMSTTPNSLHSLYAQTCGLQPSLGLRHPEYDDPVRLNTLCLPAILNRHGFFTAFHTTSAISLQHRLGFNSTWSTMGGSSGVTPVANVSDSARLSVQNDRDQVVWPLDGRWWELPKDRRPAPEAKYTWLGHHDAYGLPSMADFVESRAEDERFMLQIFMCSTHSPYVGKRCPLSGGGDLRRGVARAAPRPTLSKYALRRWPSSRTEELSRYLRELECADRYVEEVYNVLRRAGRLEDTSIVLTSDHGEGFELGHMNDIKHGGTLYDSQMHIPLVVFGPLARDMPKRVRGVWSYTALVPTLLEGLGITLPHVARHTARDSPSTPLSHAPAAQDADVSRANQVELAARAVAEPDMSDLHGQSILSNHASPSRRAFLASTFEPHWLGMVDGPYKYIVKDVGGGGDLMGPDRLARAFEVYDIHNDTYETRNIAAQLSASTKQSLWLKMRTWEHAVDQLHSTPMVRSPADGKAARSALLGDDRLAIQSRSAWRRRRRQVNRTAGARCALVRQASLNPCVAGRTFGCSTQPSGVRALWVLDGCRGRFRCDRHEPAFDCGDRRVWQPQSTCFCSVSDPRKAVTTFPAHGAFSRERLLVPEFVRRAGLLAPEALQGAKYRWQTVGTGFCDLTKALGDCESGSMGIMLLRSDALRGAKMLEMSHGGKNRGWTAAAELCMDTCLACSRCRYISLSLKFGDCSWFQTCDMARLRLEIPGEEGRRLGEAFLSTQRATTLRSSATQTRFV